MSSPPFRRADDLAFAYSASISRAWARADMSSFAMIDSALALACCRDLRTRRFFRALASATFLLDRTLTSFIRCFSASTSARVTGGMGRMKVRWSSRNHSGAASSWKLYRLYASSRSACFDLRRSRSLPIAIVSARSSVFRESSESLSLSESESSCGTTSKPSASAGAAPSLARSRRLRSANPSSSSSSSSSLDPPSSSSSGPAALAPAAPPPPAISVRATVTSASLKASWSNHFEAMLALLGALGRVPRSRTSSFSGPSWRGSSAPQVTISAGATSPSPASSPSSFRRARLRFWLRERFSPWTRSNIWSR